MIAAAFAVLRLIPPRLLFTVIAIVVALAALLWFIKRHDAAVIERAAIKQNQINQEKHDAATKADSDARLCAADPSCRMRPDQYLRR